MKICNQCGFRSAAPYRKICYSCKNQRYQDKHPLRVAFLRLKHHAKHRDKQFTLTYSQFEQFAQKVDYIAKKGRSAQSYHIDRIDESQGYHIDNIQLLTNADNVKKYKQWYMNELGKSDFRVVTNNAANSLQDDQDCPF